tara:strand:+ start:1103 stop:2458 length:1356 start_codon:yes stop_codon:yes gene_type:complete
MAQRQQSFTSANFFQLRRLYLSSAVPNQEYNNFFDSFVNPFYGKVNFDGNMIYPSEKYLKKLRTLNSVTKNQLYALNFVTDAFSDLQDYVDRASSLGLLNTNNALANLSPVKSWTSLHTMYGGVVDALYSSLINQYLEKPSEFFGLNHARPKDFDDFMKSMKNVFNNDQKRYMLTRASFISSVNCPFYISGLVIEVAPSIGYSNDHLKDSTFLKSANFKFYMNTLKKFGFMADKNYPGRIIADIGSPPMQEYMAKYGITFDNLFENYFYKASDYDFNNVKIYLSQFYNTYVSQFPAKSETKGKGVQKPYKDSFNLARNATTKQAITQDANIIEKACSTTSRVLRQRLTDEDFRVKYNDDYWIGVYSEMLNYELGRPHNTGKVEKIIKNAKNLKRTVDLEFAIGYINESFKQYYFPTSIYSLVSRETTPTDTPQTVQQVAATQAPTGGGGSY